MERGFKYRIYPNESQRDQIARTFGCCRFVYNRALDVKKTAYSETGKSIATRTTMTYSTVPAPNSGYGLHDRFLMWGKLNVDMSDLQSMTTRTGGTMIPLCR